MSLSSKLGEHDMSHHGDVGLRLDIEQIFYTLLKLSVSLTRG